MTLERMYVSHLMTQVKNIEMGFRSLQADDHRNKAIQPHVACIHVAIALWAQSASRELWWQAASLF